MPDFAHTPLTLEQLNILDFMRRRKHKALEEQLKKKNSSADFMTETGLTPLLAAMLERDDKSIKILLAANARVNFPGYLQGSSGAATKTTPLHLCISRNDVKYCGWFLQKYDSISKISDSAQYLLYTAELRKLEIAKLLIAHGADVNAVYHGSRPLIAAVNKRDLAMCQLLKAHGAEIDLLDKHEMNSWDYAFSNLCMPGGDIDQDRLDILLCLADLTNPKHVEKMRIYVQQTGDKRLNAYLPVLSESISNALVAPVESLPIDMPGVSKPSKETRSITLSELRTWLSKLAGDEVETSVDRNTITFSDRPRVTDTAAPAPKVSIPKPVAKPAEKPKRAAKIKEENVTTFSEALAFAKQSGRYNKVWEYFDVTNLTQQKEIFTQLVDTNNYVVCTLFLNKSGVSITPEMRKEAAKKPEVLRVVENKLQENLQKEKTAAAATKIKAVQKQVQPAVVPKPVRAPRPPKTQSLIPAHILTTLLRDLVIRFADRAVDKSEKIKQRKSKVALTQRAQEEIVRVPTSTKIMEAITQVEPAPAEVISDVQVEVNPVVELEEDNSLYDAAIRGDIDRVRALLSDSKQRNSNEANMVAAFMWAGTQVENPDLMQIQTLRQLLVDYGVLYYPLDEQGNMLMHCAVRERNYALLNLILCFSNNVLFFQNQEGVLPLDIAACELEDWGLTRYLLLAGASPDKSYSEYFAGLADGRMDPLDAVRAKSLQKLFVDFQFKVLANSIPGYHPQPILPFMGNMFFRPVEVVAETAVAPAEKAPAARMS